MTQHEPQVIPLVDVADRWVVRCYCGCGTTEQYALQEEADDRADQLRDENDGPSERAQVAGEVEGMSDPI